MDPDRSLRTKIGIMRMYPGLGLAVINDAVCALVAHNSVLRAPVLLKTGKKRPELPITRAWPSFCIVHPVHASGLINPVTNPPRARWPCIYAYGRFVSSVVGTQAIASN